MGIIAKEDAADMTGLLTSYTVPARDPANDTGLDHSSHPGLTTDLDHDTGTDPRT